MQEMNDIEIGIDTTKYNSMVEDSVDRVKRSSAYVSPYKYSTIYDV